MNVIRKVASLASGIFVGALLAGAILIVAAVVKGILEGGELKDSLHDQERMS